MDIPPDNQLFFVMEKDCIVCRNKEFISIYAGTLKQCPACGYVVANMEIDTDLLRSVYGRNYFFGEEYLNYVKDKDILQLNFKKRLDYILKHITRSEEISNCLEIGCAYGFFGEVLLKNTRTAYTGIDIVPDAIEYGTNELGIHLLCADYLALPAPGTLYSDVFLWDVIEHLQSPGKVLEKAANELVKGGRIYITTGNFSSLLSKVQREKWRLIHPPSHIHYFSEDNLIGLLGNYHFKVVAVKYFPVYRSIQQMAYSLFVLNKKQRLLQGMVRKIPSGWHVGINTYDIMCVAAVKQ